MLSRIVAEENGPGESTVDDVEFPQLEWVELRDLPNLVSFFPNVNITSLAKLTDHYHNPLQPQPLFSEKVAIPRLESLELSRLENVSDLWSSELPTGSFSKLKKLEVRYCPSLRNMFHHSMAIGLLNLQNLFISDCLTLEAVVGKEEQVGGHGRQKEKTLFPELGKLQLGRLPNLRRFCHFTHPLEIPLLSEVDILDCPNMDAFSLEPMSTPNLSLPGTSWKGDLNNAIPLLQEVSLPNLKVLKLAKLENLERLGDDQLSVGSFSQLKEISVCDCGKLLCVIPSQLLSMLRDLENLKVECCNLLEVIFELEGVDYNEPNPEILSPLKLVKLSNLPELSYISKRDPMGFKYIQALDIYNCNRLTYVFSPTMTKSIPQLRELRISRCEILSRIIAEENELGESTVDVVEFPRLECAGLYDLPNLVSFFPNVNTTSLAKSTDHYHNPMQPQPLFNEKVVVPSLEYLELSGLENVSDLWSSELPTASFTKLKELKVRYCGSLRNMFHPSMAGGLLNLQNLFISDCSILEAVVGKEEQVGGHGRQKEKTLFPKLGKLQLGRLPNLRRFCHFTHPLEIPLLSKVDILDCPNMDAFSLEPVSAPNLSLPGTSWKGDLNNAIPLLQERHNSRKERENQRKEEEKEKEHVDGDVEEKEKVDEDEEEEDQEEKRKGEEEEETTEKCRKRKWTDLDEDGED
ncbi:hypothetical protein Vadar_026625 [Vaccinium darrowii]|uniref:Uncharacterized protein n=1 Tax=Vaccinium darrowii TaxID=229202 RepID=A0ACB7XT75_9ERIC|nr:hypothetical protein Vadar_026625 [Vaccinium darrowii]